MTEPNSADIGPKSSGLDPWAVGLIVLLVLVGCAFLAVRYA